MSANTQNQNFKKGHTTMSKNDASVVAAPVAIELEKSYKYFDLDSFEKKTVTGKTSFTPAGSIDEASQRINGDETKLLAAINAYLQKETLRELKASVLPANAGNTAVLSSLMKPFRAMPPFSLIEDRKKQTEAILNMIKGIPQLVEQIKTASVDAEDDDSTDTDV